MELDLATRQLIVVTGKGGVGKSAVAAALGRRLAASRRVLVLEVDPRENVHQLFGAPPSGGEWVELDRRLHLQNLRPGQVLRQLVTEKLKLEALSRRVLGSPIYRAFSEGAPGLEQMAVLGHALRVLEGSAPGVPPIDTIVLDAPATGHGVSLLSAPQLVADAIAKGPIGRMSREVAELIGDAARTALVVVTLAEEMPATEALELRESMIERLGRAPDLLVVNQLYPPIEQKGGGNDLALDLWRRRRRLNETELARLDAGWPEPQVELPFLALERGPELVEALGAELFISSASRSLASDEEPSP